MPPIDFPSNHEKKDNITFSYEDIDFNLEDERLTGEWLKEVIEREEKVLLSLNFIFCSDRYLHKLNIEYLDHDTFTDVITFPYASPPNIEGDIFISIDRIKENAIKYNAPFLHELHQVMAHGVLHLCGFDDKTPEEAIIIRQKENEALALFVKE